MDTFVTINPQSSSPVYHRVMAWVNQHGAWFNTLFSKEITVHCRVQVRYSHGSVFCYVQKSQEPKRSRAASSLHSHSVIHNLQQFPACMDAIPIRQVYFQLTFNADSWTGENEYSARWITSPQTGGKCESCHAKNGYYDEVSHTMRQYLPLLFRGGRDFG